MVMQTINSVLGRLRKEAPKFKITLGYMVRPCLKKKRGRGAISCF
jgi:hypothetical protein